MSDSGFESWEQYIYSRDVHGKELTDELIDHFGQQITKPDLKEFCDHHISQVRKAMSPLKLGLMGIAFPSIPKETESLDENTVRTFLGERWGDIFKYTERLYRHMHGKDFEHLPYNMYLLGQAVESLNLPTDALLQFYKRKAMLDHERAKGY